MHLLSDEAIPDNPSHLLQWNQIFRMLFCLSTSFSMYDTPSKTMFLYTIVNYIVTMATTIQISEELLEVLKNRKMHSKESYEDIIWDLIEDTMELSEETKRRIAQSEKEIERGETASLAEIKKKLGL